MAAAAAPAGEEEQDDMWNENRPFLFMPFRHTQRFERPLKCDGALMMYELSSAVFTPAARGWTDLLMLSVRVRRSLCCGHHELTALSLQDRVRLVKMLTFLLQVACDCNATVCIETVVENQDFTLNHDCELGDDCVVTAYRFWFPMDAAQEIAFLHATSAAISPLKTTTELLQADHTWMKKKRRVEQFNDQIIPEFARPVSSVSELTR